MIKIYTDGSCIGNPGNGGWAAIIIDDGKKTQIKGSKKNNKFIFNKKKSTNLIRGYSKIRRFSDKEKKSLNTLCKGAALRYLLTRTYDYLNTPKSAIIKIKNPREYIQKIKVHNKFNNFKNYYN